MKIAIGTTNKGKVEAVQNGLNNYSEYTNSEIISIEVVSGVGAQPQSLAETIRGAKNRAKQAFDLASADLGFGLESGLFPVPETKSEYMDTTACAIYDGQNFHLGLSSCFEYPKAMVKKILEEGKEITDIALELGFFENRNCREDGGMIGILTRGVVTRKKYSEQAVHMAMVHLLNKDHY